MPSSKIKTTQELIDEHIEKLHKTASSDWQSLLRQVDKAAKPVPYNIAQMAAAMCGDDPSVKEINLEWGRGTGKTTYIGHFTRDCVTEMPRSIGMIIGETYQQILTRILPSIKDGLAMQGIYENLHYFVGRRPPRSWNFPTAYKQPDKFNNYIWFWTGAGIHLVSQDVSGDGRAYNADFEVKDECALLDIEKLDSTTSPALRGSKVREFINCRNFTRSLNASSTPLTPKGRWFIEREEAAYRDKKGAIKFIRADARANKDNLVPDYLERAKGKTLPLIYNAEYLNKRVKLSGINSFYGFLNEKIHAYNSYDYKHYKHVGQSIDCRGDADRLHNDPLILGVDWGAAINCCVVNQVARDEHRCLKNFYALGADDKIQEDLFQEFHEYYKEHGSRRLYIWYDNTGNVRTGITKRTRAQMAAAQLRQLGWDVQLMTVGMVNEIHETKFLLYQLILQENDPRFRKFRMNQSNARETWVSMTSAKFVQVGKGQIKKDKSSEKSSKANERQYATDLSDAQDTVIVGMYVDILRDMGVTLPEITMS